jgi:hypothetical protein
MTRDGPTPGITIFTGRFGSGKTEAAISYALSLARVSPFLIDLDIVTPYFRSREAADALRQQGVDVVAPAATGQHLDTPAITPAILGAIEQTDRLTILDVGGDYQGARALGQFRLAISARGYDMHFVANPYRPFTDSIAGIARSIAEIEASSRLRVTSIVSNPNLMGETTAAQIVAGHREIERSAQQLDLPIAFLCVERRWAGFLGSDHLSLPMLVLDRLMVPPWEKGPLSIPGLRLPRG